MELSFLTYLILGSYFMFSIYAQIRINRIPLLSKKRKSFHTIMSWLIPFLWFLIVKDFIDYESYTMTKRVRDKRLRARNPKYYESRKGFFGH